jgi:hypothetical protein
MSALTERSHPAQLSWLPENVEVSARASRACLLAQCARYGGRLRRRAEDEQRRPPRDHQHLSPFLDDARRPIARSQTSQSRLS